MECTQLTEKMKLLTYIIPAYNCEHYIHSCIRKINAVDLSDYEVIIIDDGSTDNTPNICDRIANSNKKVKCIHQLNMGASSARNRGLEEATGEYVLFLDADDEIEPEELRNLIEKLRTLSDVDMVIFGLSFDYYHKGILYRRDELKTPMNGILDKTSWISRMAELYNSNSLSPIWNKIIRRGLILEKGLFLREDMFLYEDLEYSLRCMKHCDRILFDSAEIYHYRQSEDEGNAGRRLKKIVNLTDVVSRIEEAFGQTVSLEQKEEILLSLYLVLAREKISVSDRKEINIVCEEFEKWYKTKGYQKRDTFIDQLLEHKVRTLIAKRNYISVRHDIAVKVKSTAWYQRWKG